MLPESLQRFNTHPIKVLDQGEVQLVDVMGDDSSIVQAARVSYGEGTKSVSDDRTLLRYLMRHRHTSPFEMCEIKLRVRVPMDCWRHWIRHRTASVNECSTRYSEALNASLVAETWRKQATDNKQGSSTEPLTWPDGFGRREATDDCPEGCWVLAYSGETFFTSPQDYLSEEEAILQRHARDVYQERLDFRVAREQARKDLPLSTYTEAYWKIDLRNLFHFLSLRLPSDAQEEIRHYAEAIAEIVKVWVPEAWAAFEDYVLHGLTLSYMEQRGIALALNDAGFIDRAVRHSGLTRREAKEMRANLERLYASLVTP